MYMVVCVHVYIQYVCLCIYSMCACVRIYSMCTCVRIYSMCCTFLSSLIMQLCVTHPVPMGSVLLMTLAIALDSVDPLAAHQVSYYTQTHTHTYIHHQV